MPILFVILALEPRTLTRWDVHKYARQAYDLGVRYIGGCCGFEPYHIRAIAEEVSSRKRVEKLNFLKVAVLLTCALEDSHLTKLPNFLKVAVLLTCALEDSHLTKLPCLHSSNFHTIKLPCFHT